MNKVVASLVLASLVSSSVSANTVKASATKASATVMSFVTGHKKEVAAVAAVVVGVMCTALWAKKYPTGKVATFCGKMKERNMGAPVAPSEEVK